MPLFGSGSPFDKEIELATSETSTIDDWAQILNICDKAVNYEDGSKYCLQSIIKRMHHSTPRVALQALTILDACIKNCGKSFHLEVASQQFTGDVRKLLKKGHPQVVQKMKELLKTWAEESFKDDPQLCLIPALYYKLKSEGLEFPEPVQADVPKSFSTNPDVVSSQQEEDDIVKAIEMSLKDTGGFKQSLHLSVSQGGPKYLESNYQEPHKVRALYDFETEEADELSFKTGEIILVLDASDANWWKGSNHRGEGLFPSSFVTDLNNVQKPIDACTEKSEDAAEAQSPVEVTIDEEKISHTLHMLDIADPTGEIPDPEDLKHSEALCNAMAPLIEDKLQKIDGKLAALTSVNKELLTALNMYYEVSREPVTEAQFYPPEQYRLNPGFVKTFNQNQVGPQLPDKSLQQNMNFSPQYPVQPKYQPAPQIPAIGTTYPSTSSMSQNPTGPFMPFYSVPVCPTNTSVKSTCGDIANDTNFVTSVASESIGTPIEASDRLKSGDDKSQVFTTNLPLTANTAANEMALKYPLDAQSSLLNPAYTSAYLYPANHGQSTSNGLIFTSSSSSGGIPPSVQAPIVYPTFVPPVLLNSDGFMAIPTTPLPPSSISSVAPPFNPIAPHQLPTQVTTTSVVSTPQSFSHSPVTYSSYSMPALPSDSAHAIVSHHNMDLGTGQQNDVLSNIKNNIIVGEPSAENLSRDSGTCTAQTSVSNNSRANSSMSIPDMCNGVDIVMDIFASPVNHSVPPLQPQTS